MLQIFSNEYSYLDQQVDQRADSLIERAQRALQLKISYLPRGSDGHGNRQQQVTDTLVEFDLARNDLESDETWQKIP